jgi:hypothetical protein
MLSVMDSVVLVIICLATFALATWRLPFVQESALVSLFLGLAFAAIYAIAGFAYYCLFGDFHYFIHRTIGMALALGLLLHSAVVYFFGPRLRP